MTSAFAFAMAAQNREAMTCAMKRERWMSRGLKYGVKKRYRGAWVVYDVLGAPCAIRASWRDAYNTAYARAYEGDAR